MVIRNISHARTDGVLLIAVAPPKEAVRHGSGVRFRLWGLPVEAALSGVECDVGWRRCGEGMRGLFRHALIIFRGEERDASLRRNWWLRICGMLMGCLEIPGRETLPVLQRASDMAAIF